MKRLNPTNWWQTSTALFLFIFVCALSIRLIYLYQIQALPYTHYLFLDAASYDRMARAIAAGDWLGKKVFYQAPLYPYFLALCYRLFDYHLNIVRFIQLVLGAFNCVLITWIARKTFDIRTARWAAFFSLFYGILIFYEGAIGKDGLSILLTDTLLLALILSIEKPAWHRWLLSGMALGGGVLTRGNLMLLLPIYLIWGFFSLKRLGLSLKRSSGIMGVFIIGTALIILPVSTRNYVVGNDFVLTTCQGGQNFYIGNNPRANGFFENPKNIRLHPMYEESDFRAEALRRTGRKDMKPSEISSFWFKEGLRFIYNNPKRWLALLFRKTIMFWNHFEIPDNYNYYFARSNVPILRILFFNFGIVAPLGVLGLFLAPRSTTTLVLIIFILSYMFSIVPFHMASRYRLPVVPVLIVFGAYTITWWSDALRNREYRRVLRTLIPLTMLGLFVNWKFVCEKETFKASFTGLGIVMAESGDYKKAIQYYKKALAIDPRYVSAYYNMGNALVNQGNLSEAVQAYQNALKIDPEFLLAYDNLAKTYIIQGRFDDALKTYQNALMIRPDFADAYVGMGIVYHSMGLYKKAIDANLKALLLQPDLAKAHYNLACAYARSGSVREALKALKQAVRLNPAYGKRAIHDPDLKGINIETHGESN
nr:tetratricopeptide repeat protein [Desulfobacterales bacterium]